MFSSRFGGLAIFFILTTSFSFPAASSWGIFTPWSSAKSETFKKCLHTNVTIDCFQKDITDIKKGSFINSSIAKVDLRLNELKNLSKGQLVGGNRLKTLMISHNLIKFIAPSTFDSFLNLENLYLDHNELHKLDCSIFKGLSRLRALFIARNFIVSIDPETFQYNHDLFTLSLYGNPLLTFKYSHSFLHSVPRLHNLDLSDTGLQTIPWYMFKNLTKLRRLRLDNNNMSSVPTEALKGLSSLVSLEFSANPIKTMQSGAFAGLSNLKLLTLNNMPVLEKIREGVFDGLVELKSLYCSYNYKLFMLHRWAFSGHNPVRRMTTVILKSNNLTMLHEDTLPWRDIYKLDLSDNPWNCDCDIMWMSNLRVSTALLPHFKCSSPRSMANKSIALTTPIQFVCVERTPLSSIFAISFISVILAVISITVVFVLVYRMKLCIKMKAAYQKEYKVFSNKDVVEISVNGEEFEENRVGVTYGTTEIDLNNSGDEEDCFDARNQRRQKIDENC